MIRVELCVVYVSVDDGTDYELKFVDDDGRMGDTLRVGNDGSLMLLDDDEE